ncbi:rhodanese-like domain-containing protein [Jiangella endophytica]|uniref:rhodanese-like domain-containing protein n=1 Tax=Jiangella endophytica TaxID=1623398 RepID=UPI0018E568AD|nr:rhodanese-like domain-containing protein [Jiangella endophytica]
MTSSPFFVDPADLAAELAAGPPPLLLDVRFSPSGPDLRPEYEAGHLPGAHFVELQAQLAGPGGGTEGRRPLPSPEALQETLRGWGIDDLDQPVVVYDNRNGLTAGRAWWVLTWAGLTNVRLLDGGYGAWADSGGATTTEEPAAPAPGRVVVRPGQLPTLTADEAQELALTGVLLDSRGTAAYQGGEPGQGHIPGALDAGTRHNLSESGRLAGEETLRSRFEALGVRAGTPVGAYCGGGVAAAHQVLVLKSLGIDAALFVGSWSAWSADLERPVATGPDRGLARAVRIRAYGGPEVLEVVDLPRPVPGPGEVLVEVRAAGVNPVDWRIRLGQRSTTPLEAPRGLGSDAAGVVVAVGDGVGARSVGDEVIVVGSQGSYASHVVTTPARTLLKPRQLSWAQAAAVGIPTGTAYQALTSLRLVGEETLLVHAGAGAVGQAALQFARQWGVRAIATARPGNHDRLRELGAVPVEYGPGLLDRVRAAAPGGVDVVLDAAGTAEALDVSLALVADRTRIGTVVAVERAEELGIRAWSGSRPGWLTPDERALRHEGVALAVELAAKEAFAWEIAAELPLDDVAQAHRLSEDGHVRGKVVLTP